MPVESDIIDDIGYIADETVKIVKLVPKIVGDIREVGKNLNLHKHKYLIHKLGRRKRIKRLNHFK